MWDVIVRMAKIITERYMILETEDNTELNSHAFKLGDNFRRIEASINLIRAGGKIQPSQLQDVITGAKWLETIAGLLQIQFIALLKKMDTDG